MKKLNIGGRALTNGIMLQSKNYRVEATYNEAGFIEYKEEEQASRSKELIGHIPFLRGFITIFDGTVGKITGTILFLSLILNGPFGQFGWFNIVLASLPLIIIALGVVAVNKSKYKELFIFHGAEHAVVNAYEKTKKTRLEMDDINFDNILADRCGSNYVVFYFLFGIIFYIMLGNVFSISASIFLITSIAYEFFSLITSIRWFNFVSRLAFPVQRIFVKRPEKKHIRAGLAAFNRLMELEKR